MDWKIKPGYIERREPAYCVDKPDGNFWQWDVYETALSIALHVQAEWVLDLGCGSGEKLEMMFGAFNRVGLDIGENIERCRATYPNGHWEISDLEIANFKTPPSLNGIIICADVIEHLKNPRSLLTHLAVLAKHVKGIFLSTPDRDLTHGEDHNGPPPNTGHVREWNLSELCAYLASIDFPMKSIAHIPCRKNDGRRITTMVVA